MAVVSDVFNEIIKPLSNSGPLAAVFILVLLAPLLAKIVMEVLKARIQLTAIRAKSEENKAYIASKRRESGRTRRTSSAANRPGDAGAVVNTNFDILEKYYEQTLAENRLLSRSAIGVALLGFFVILIGVSLAFAGFTSVGVVSSVAGLLAEAATLMFFNQLREQIKQVQDYHKKLVSTQYLMTSIALVDKLNSDQHEAELIKIINNLLFLSNELHGSKSDHLFASGHALEVARPTPPSPSVERLPVAKATPPAA